MIGLKEMLAQELKRMEKIKFEAEQGLRNTPEGMLRIGKSQGVVQYYQRMPEGGNNGRYIQKKDMELIRSLAQKSYDEKVLKCAQKRLGQLSRILKDYDDNEIEQIYLREHPERQKLINIVEPTRKQQQDECPLYLEPYGIVYPDFTFLSPKTGLELYWEHEGMMDQPDYARNAVKKIELYESNGIHIGERLILTFETSNSVINANIVKDYAERYLV